MTMAPPMIEPAIADLVRSLFSSLCFVSIAIRRKRLEVTFESAVGKNVDVELVMDGWFVSLPQSIRIGSCLEVAYRLLHGDFWHLKKTWYQCKSVSTQVYIILYQPFRGTGAARIDTGRSSSIKVAERRTQVWACGSDRDVWLNITQIPEDILSLYAVLN